MTELANRPSEIPKLDDLIKVEDLWFDDGSVVFCARPTKASSMKDGLYGFRVHRSWLAVNSPIFLDMFKTPQPEEQPNVEGCPVVYMHDCAQDLKYFFKSAYYAGCVACGLSTP
jgi:hypothetical protein